MNRLVIAAVGALGMIALYLYTKGSSSHAVVPPTVDPGTITRPAGNAWANLINQPWFYPAAGAVIIGGALVFLWSRIGSGGRILLAVVGGVILAYSVLGGRP